MISRADGEQRINRCLVMTLHSVMGDAGSLRSGRACDVWCLIPASGLRKHFRRVTPAGRTLSVETTLAGCPLADRF